MSNPQVILITGASSGIGLVVAQALAEQGHMVYGTSRKAQDSDQAFEWLILDVTDPDSIVAAVDLVLTRHQRLDVLINNAGLGMIATFEEAPAANVDTVMDTNFGGVLRMSQAVLPHMRQQGSGKIINVSSIAGLTGLPYRSIYSASKFAVEGLTEALRQEVAKFGIQVCTLQPGSIRTDIKDNRVSHIPQDSSYQPELGQAEKIIDTEVGKGIEAGQVADKISQLIRQPRLRPKYVVAKPFQVLVTYLKRLIPHAWFERLMMNHYGLKRQ